MRAVEASLRRLATDRIDLYYLHRFDDATDLDETLRARRRPRPRRQDPVPGVLELRRVAGRARARASRRCEGCAPLVAIQPMYNLVKRTAEVEILPMAQSLGLAVIPYSPTGGGLLTGKYGVGEAPATGRLLDTKMYTTRYATPAFYEIAERFCALARELGHAPVTLARRVGRLAPRRDLACSSAGATSSSSRPRSRRRRSSSMRRPARGVSALSPAPPPATDRNEEAGAQLRRALRLAAAGGFRIQS